MNTRNYTPALKIVCLDCIHLWRAGGTHSKDFCPKCGSKDVRVRGETKPGYRKGRPKALVEIEQALVEPSEGTK